MPARTHNHAVEVLIGSLQIPQSSHSCLSASRTVVPHVGHMSTFEGVTHILLLKIGHDVKAQDARALEAKTSRLSRHVMAGRTMTQDSSCFALLAHSQHTTYLCRHGMVSIIWHQAHSA